MKKTFILTFAIGDAMNDTETTFTKTYKSTSYQAVKARGKREWSNTATLIDIKEI